MTPNILSTTVAALVVLGAWDAQAAFPEVADAASVPEDRPDARPSSPVAADGSRLTWDRLPDLPNLLGLGGPLVGVHDGVVLVAGGANFPEGPPWAVGDRPAGKKVWHDAIFALEPGKKGWRFAGALPRPLAYAPAVSLPSGVYILGGESYGFKKSNYDTANVWRLTWDRSARRVLIDKNAAPPLPKPCSYHAAAAIGERVYVAASHARAMTSRRLDVSSFWTLDLSQPKSKRRWVELPSWPGAARQKMSLAACRAPAADGTLREQLLLISGSSWAKDQNGEMDLARFEYFDDAYRYDPRATSWKRVADLPRLPESREIRDALDGSAERPRPAAAACALGDRAGRVLLFSGSTGRYVTRPVEDRPPFPREVLAYDPVTDRWSLIGQMPLGVVTTSAVWWQERIVIASGETRPGIRTRAVQRLHLAEEAP